MKKRNSFWLFATACCFVLTTACNSDEPNGGDDNKGGDDNTEEPTLGNSLEGSDYYLFFLDPTSEAKIANKITQDCRPDEGSIQLQVWENTYTAATISGPNFYGEVESWPALSVTGGAGWSGMGICVVTPTYGGSKTVDLTGITREHTFHIAMRSRDTKTHCLTLLGADNSDKGSIAIGATDFNDNGVITKVYTDFKRDGEWHEIEIPMSVFFDRGLIYRNNKQNSNVVTFLSGGDAGTSLQFDAMFIYKKKK